MKFVFLSIILVFFISTIVIANGILVGDGKKESDVILVGKIISFEENIPKQETNYLVNVEEYLKAPKNYDIDTKTVTITSPGLPKHPELADSVIYDKVYEIGNRVLFLLYYRDGKLEESFYSLTTKSDCSPEQLLDQMYGPSGFSITQNNQSKHLYTNKPIDLEFYVYNRDLASEKKDFEFAVFTPNGKISEKRQIQLQECIRSSDVHWSFIPTISGKYTFSATIGNNEGGSESISGILIEDYVASPLQQYKSGIPANQIQCKKNLVLLLRPITETPICVKPQTEQKLVSRGWYYPVPLGWPNYSQNVFLEGFKDSYKTNESISFTVVIKSGQKCGSTEISIIDASTSEFVTGIGIDYMCVTKYLSGDSRIDVPYQGQDMPLKIDKVGSYKLIVKLEGESVFEKKFVVRENTK